MTTQTTSRFRVFFLLATIPLLIGTIGCSDDDNGTTPTDDAITDNLYPLSIGRQIVFSGFLRDKATDTNITATGAIYETRWTIASNTSPTPVGGTSNLVLDSTQVPTGIPTPPAIWVMTPLFIQRASAPANADMAFLQNVGPFYRRFGIVNPDTLKWFLLARFGTGYGLGKEWSAFDSTWAAPTGNVRLQVVSKWEGRETLTLAGQTFNTYKLTTTRKIYLGGSASPSVESPTATLWLVSGVGPVKMILNTDGENYGHYREFKSKNF